MGCCVERAKGKQPEYPFIETSLGPGFEIITEHDSSAQEATLSSFRADTREDDGVRKSTKEDDPPIDKAHELEKALMGKNNGNEESDDEQSGSDHHKQKAIGAKLIGSMALGMAKKVKNQQMADLLQSNPNVATELSEMIKKDGLKAIIEEMKNVQTKKKYKVGKTNRQAQCVSKDAFVNIGNDYKEGGLSEEVINAIEPVVCLSTSQPQFYQVALLEALFAEV